MTAVRGLHVQGHLSVLAVGLLFTLLCMWRRGLTTQGALSHDAFFTLLLTHYLQHYFV